MVLTKSEYQNQFRTTALQKGQAVYEENLTFRHQRRDREFLHTPICWGEQEDEEPDLSDSNEIVADRKCVKKKQEPEPQYQSLAEILEETKEKNLAHRKRQRSSHYKDNAVPEIETNSVNCDYNGVDFQEHKKINDKTLDEFVNEENKKLIDKLAQMSLLTEETEDGNTRCVEDDADIKKKLSDKHGKQSKFNLRKKVNSKNRNEDTLDTDKSRKRAERKASAPTFTKLKRPDRQAKIPSAKHRPFSACTSSADKPPFMAYGSGDREDCLALHRTHNVRSSADVYPLALKAKQRLEEGKKRHKEKILRARSAEALIEQLSSATPRDSIDWRSEYQKQFHVYEPKEYERALSSRAVIPHSVPIRAVHRGGCLIVHVD